MPKNTTTHNNLGYLGETFQNQLVKCFIESPKFFTNIIGIVDQNMFTNEHLRRIVGIMKDRYTQNGVLTSYTTLETIIRSQVTNSITIEELLQKLHDLQSLKLDGLDVITEQSEKFFKQQNLAKAINKCLEILKRGNSESYYEMEDLIKKALDTNMSQDIGFHIFDGWMDVLKEDYRYTVPTGIDVIDNALFGGLGKGELGVVIAPLGTGKTSATTGFAAHAATYKCDANNYEGYKVLHFFFEDSEVSIKRKYYGYITDIDACYLSDENIRPRVIEMLKSDKNEMRDMIQKNIIARRLQSGEVSASDIKYLIQQHISRGFVPDLVILDYFECLKHEKNTDGFNGSEWSQEGITMRKLETIANEFNLALWVPVQSTKSAIGQEVVGLQDSGGSVKKTQIGHVVLTFAQTDEQKRQGRINIFIGKFRAGRITRTQFPNIKFNNGTCKFDTSDMDEGDVFGETQNTNNNFANRSRDVARMTR